ncbi:MAG TPA: T9SS type A sorting domain-containing protein, partial [Bacteroidia bacterium]|nr:T9SS type A sorting domain-containing protein [Bacteroidia bacterium]
IIDSIAATLNESKDWNFTVWPILGTYIWPNPSPYPTTYSGEIQNLKNWVNTRLTWIDNNIPGHCNCSVTAGQQNVSCVNACDGVAFASGVSPYQKMYSWDTGITNDTISQLCPGAYELTFEDAVGCKRVTTVTITEPSPITVNVNATSASCTGNGCNASATAVPGGGTPPYSYLWSDGQTTATATGLCAGSVRVVVTDSRGCKDSAAAVISNPVAPVVTIGTQANVSCHGGSNGSASVSVSGGNPPFTYAWSPSGGNQNSANGLVAGTYEVTVTDLVGCEGRVTVIITEPVGMTATVTGTSLTCFNAANGSATATINGGTQPYTYVWSPSGGTGSTATQLTAGTFTVTATDAGSCTVTSSVTLSQPAAMTTTISNIPVSCFGGSNGSATIIPSGGTGSFTYLWSPGNFTQATINGLSAGNYSVTVTDGNGCTTTTQTTLSQAAAITATTSTTPSTCGQSDGTATVVASGGTPGYTYLWLPTGGSGAAVTNLSAGTYTVTITDANSCTSTSTAVVANSSGLITSVNSQTNVSCFGGSNGSGSVLATGGTMPYTYSWSPAGGTAASASGLSAGLYTITVTDINGCTSLQQIRISQPAVLSLTMAGIPAVCFGGGTGSASVSVSGGTPGYTYAWLPSGGSGSVAGNLSSGTYQVTVTDLSGCTATSSTVVTQPPAIAIVLSTISANCGLDNGSITANVSGGIGAYHFAWSGSADTLNSIQNLVPGSYTVTVTDANGCTKTAASTVSSNTSPLLAVSTTQNVTCNGNSDGALSVAVTGGTQPMHYAWTPGVSTTAIATGLSAGLYSVIVTDANGCKDSIGILLDEPAPLAVLMFANNLNCHGANDGFIFADAGGGTPPYSYSWNPGGQVTDSAVQLGAGAYSVVVTDSLGCFTTSSASISEPDALTASVTSQDVTCFSACNGSAQVNISGGVQPYYLNWCNGDTVMIQSNLCPGTCQVVISDGNGCFINKSFTISEPSPLAISLQHIDATCQGCSDGSATASANGGLPPYAYQWTPSGQTTAQATNLSAGVYTLCITDSGNCTQCDTVQIMDGSIGIDELRNNTALYLFPNPFSEYTTFVFGLKQNEKVSLEIFDLAGQLVEPLLNTEIQAGEHVIRFDGSLLSPGVYLYRFLTPDRMQTGRLILNR